jgi:hypothetical protein
MGAMTSVTGQSTVESTGQRGIAQDGSEVLTFFEKPFEAAHQARRFKASRRWEYWGAALQARRYISTSNSSQETECRGKR